MSQIAGKIAALVSLDVTGVIHVGGERKTVYEYAKTLNERQEIKKMSTADVAFAIPRDTSLDCTRYEGLTTAIKRTKQ